MKIEKKDFDFEIKETTEAGAFKGYLSVAGNIDHHGDRVMPGAFAKTIARRMKSKKPLPILWQHYRDAPIGGATVLEEDSKGLLIEGQLLINDVRQAAEAYALAKAGIVTGMSMGYYALKEKIGGDGVRDLLEVEVMEGSLVTFAANEKATVTSVKQFLQDSSVLPSLKDFEGFLREAGFSKTQATAIAGKGLAHLLRGEPEAKQLADEDLLRGIRAALNNGLTS